MYLDHLLTQTKFALRLALSESDIDEIGTLDVTATLDDMMRHVVLEFKSEIVTENLKPRTFRDVNSIQTPATTWNFFKYTHRNSWWLSWLVKWRGIKYNIQTKSLIVTAEPKVLFYQYVAPTNLGKSTKYVEWRQEVV